MRAIESGEKAVQRRVTVSAANRRGNSRRSGHGVTGALFFSHTVCRRSSSGSSHTQPRDMVALEVLAGLPVPCARFFFYVGVLAASWWGLRAAWCLLSAVRVWVLGRGAQVGPGLGKWAVVTGATDGIGKAYAEELARRGLSIVLISRSQEKLDEVAKKIREKFNVETKVIAADFGKTTEIYERIEAGLEGLEIGVLVNNVGVAYEYPEYFLDIPDLDNTLDKLININITSVCKMTRLVMPGMLERFKGVILNISSGSAMAPVPLLTVYSATKAFVDFFSRGLHAEYRNKGITVQSVLPFYVATKLSKIRKPTWDKPSPENYVRSALNTVGLQSRTNGYLAHALMGWVTGSLLPSCLVVKMAMNVNKGIRARFLKRAKKE